MRRLEKSESLAREMKRAPTVGERCHTMGSSTSENHDARSGCHRRVAISSDRCCLDHVDVENISAQREVSLVSMPQRRSESKKQRPIGVSRAQRMILIFVQMADMDRQRRIDIRHQRLDFLTVLEGGTMKRGMDGDPDDVQIPPPTLVDSCTHVAGWESVAVHRRANLDDHRTLGSFDCCDVDHRAHGEDGVRSQARWRLQSRCEDDGGVVRRHGVDFVDCPHRHRWCQHGRPLGEPFSSEPIAIALDDGDQSVDTGRQPVDSAIPGCGVDCEGQSHSFDDSQDRVEGVAERSEPSDGKYDLFGRESVASLPDMAQRIFGFPETVNEMSARWVATGVVAQSVLFLIVREWWVLVPLTYGFVARVAAGPRFSPLGLFVTKIVTPTVTRTTGRAGRIVPGPPKRFAQGIGVVFSASALIAVLVGSTPVAVALIIGLTAAASLEAFVGYCLGCAIFAQLMRIGVIPESVCEDCNDISRRLAANSL